MGYVATIAIESHPYREPRCLYAVTLAERHRQTNKQTGKECNHFQYCGELIKNNVTDWRVGKI